MAATFKIGGPLQVFFGGTATANLLGRTVDGDAVSWDELTPKIGVPTDEAGGLDNEWIQQRAAILLSIQLNRWDDAVLNSLRTNYARNGANVAVAAEGVAGTVGLLTVANDPLTNRTLTLRPTNVTANSGDREYQFQRVFADPRIEQPMRSVGSGMKDRRMLLTLLALPTDEDVIYTVNDVTAT